MSRRTIQNAGYVYVVAPDIDLPIVQRTWSLVITQLIDELTGFAPDGQVQLHCDNHNFTARVGTGGFAGLAAIPAKATPLLATQSYTAKLSLTASEYLSDSQVVTLLANPAFPGSFTPLDLGTWPLHRNAISIYGSVNLVTASGLVAVAGASVSLTSLWRNAAQPAAPYDLVTLSGVLAAARPAASTLQKVLMTLPGPTWSLVAEAEPGTASVVLSNATGLAVGNVLGFDLGDPDRAEYATVASISGSVPATVTLALPLGFLHFAWTSTALVTPTAPGTANPVGIAAIAGDRVVLVNHPVNGISSGDVVSITGGTAPIEYQTAALFSVTTDALGNYRMPLLSRVVQFELTANDGVHTPLVSRVVPAYGNDSNRVDFLLS